MKRQSFDVRGHGLILNGMWLSEFKDASLSLHLGPFVATAEHKPGRWTVGALLLTRHGFDWRIHLR